ncbi:hypothetical protein [Janthinobacterium sp.]|uniref:hypothetical protein n=1 Tax=Janthinobacterium sp. TaxID=1871054 RepID=UPI00293D2398|nr:hypothetical protein [Janthinobacterium sp.]
MAMSDKLVSLMRAGGGIAAACTMLLSGCGSGGGSDAAVTPVAPVQTAASMSGTVAVGAPMLNATVSIKDAKGVIRSVNAGADGSYSGISTDGMTGPFSLQACGLVDANYTCFYSVVQQAGVANVTPLTNANVALALGGDPAALFAPGAGTAPPDAAALEAQRLKLKTALADVLAKAGLGDINFATMAFLADRTGMDKVLDSVKISTGIDGATSKSFVQMEGIIGSGNVFLDQSAVSGTLTAGSGADVDLTGISALFVKGLSFAIAAPDQATCASRMTAANIFDDSFSLNIDKGTPLTKANAPAIICQFAAQGGVLGGAVANPVLRDCDFTSDTAQKICTVGFNMVNGDVSFDGAELAVVLRPGAAWKLLGRDSPYEIHVGAAIQRSVRIDLPAGAQTSYTRALSFDIGAANASGATGVRAAKVYQRSLDGATWEASPLVTLTLSDACIAQLQPGDTARLSVGGGNCGGSWLSLGDSGDGATAAAAGDLLIDNFYKRGRRVKVELYADVAAAGVPVVLIKRIDGVPPKFAALAGFPWMEMDGATAAALIAYDGKAPTFTVGWAKNAIVSGKDITFGLAGNGDASQAGHDDIVGGHNSVAITMKHQPAGAGAYKMVSIYGRNSDQLGVSSSYISCGGALNCNNQGQP